MKTCCRNLIYILFIFFIFLFFFYFLYLFFSLSNKKTKGSTLRNFLILLSFLILFIIFILIYNNNNNNKNFDVEEDIENNNDNKNNHNYSLSKYNKIISNKYSISKINIEFYNKKNNNNNDNNNNNNVLISVIIPIYNQLKYIEYTLNSLKESTFKNFEVIVVDDGSTEWNSKKHLISLFNKFIDEMNITIIFNRNKGLSYSRNVGIEFSTGTWILPLDSDDLIDKSFFEKAILKIEKKRLQQSQDNIDNIVVISNLLRFKNSNIDDKKGYVNKVGDWKIPKWNRNLLRNSNLLHCSALFKKSMWKNVGGYDESCWFGWEDWDFWLRADRYFFNHKHHKHLNNKNKDDQDDDDDEDHYQHKQFEIKKSTSPIEFNNQDNFKSGLNPLVIEEELFYYRLNQEGLHSFCKENFKLCFSMFQTLHPLEYSIEELLLSHRYIGKYGHTLIKNSLINEITKHPNLSMPYFWLALIYHYGIDSNNSNNKMNYEKDDNNQIKIRNLYQKSIDLEKRFDWCWQMKLHKSIIELNTLFFNQAKKDLSQLFSKYSNIELGEKVFTIYQINIK
ncbi:hypothetical protein DDB_G0289973 [Dictyostelium discoideum AX4]|uniref:Glycosyltransferase 2-like domain-containing protein n=1 Tax=Dictyostelium discoideum TaxID=44689 RepID=Q54GU8_DICDI|nr:hypothetical protein DDB_G0289973 [Dictyostelium discoideum AX4]EAL62499.1 hypothetical protein DDB_G0289973 [Dictyostelium discoideum AX4]|eukprot:XP_635971.1 hypothetical protein DDB_G0289973 [Dictyostelium discoideum AX4]